MATERIQLNHIPRILSNKPLLEYFLSVLQDQTVELPCWPKEVPWDSCYPFPDLFVRFNGEMLVTLSANPFDPKHLVDELRMAVLSDDYKAIAKANGIGPKTAQRLVIELRDKFHLEDVLGEYDEASPATSAPEDIVSETAMALSSLGYSNVEALRAIKKVPDSESMTVEQLLKAALKHII